MFRQGLADRLAAKRCEIPSTFHRIKNFIIILSFRCFSGGICPWVATHDPLEVIARMRAPSAEYWFGTDRTWS